MHFAFYGHKLWCCADVCSRADAWLDKLGQSGPAISADAPFPASTAYWLVAPDLFVCLHALQNSAKHPARTHVLHQPAWLTSATQVSTMWTHALRVLKGAILYCVCVCRRLKFHLSVIVRGSKCPPPTTSYNLMNGWWMCNALTVSNMRHDCCQQPGCLWVSSSVSGSTLHDWRYSLQYASRCIAQPNRTLLNWLHTVLMQYLYSPHSSPRSAKLSVSELQSVKGIMMDAWHWWNEWLHSVHWSMHGQNCAKHTAQPMKCGKQQHRVLSRCSHAARYTTVACGRHDLEGDKHHWSRIVQVTETPTSLSVSCYDRTAPEFTINMCSKAPGTACSAEENNPNDR